MVEVVEQCSSEIYYWVCCIDWDLSESGEVLAAMGECAEVRLGRMCKENEG